LPRAAEARGGDSEGDRCQARDPAHGGPEKATPGDAAKPRRRCGRRTRPPRSSRWNSTLPCLSLRDQLSRIRRQGADAGKNPGRIAAEGAGKEGSGQEGAWKKGSGQEGSGQEELSPRFRALTQRLELRTR